MSKEGEILDKAKERGYSVVMTSGNRKWHSLIHERYPINLQVYVDSDEFILTHIKGTIKITTDKCGSFMNDKHFERLEREIRSIIFDLL